MTGSPTVAPCCAGFLGRPVLRARVTFRCRGHKRQHLKDRSEQDLTRLQTMLQQYRNALSGGYDLAVDWRGLDPNKPATVALLHSATPATNPQPSASTQPASQCSPRSRTRHGLKPAAAGA